MSRPSLGQPHHDGSPLYVSDPEPVLGDVVTVWLRVPAGDATRGVYVRSTPDGEPHWDTAVVDRVTPTEAWWRAEVRVANPVTTYRFLLTDPHRWVTQAGVLAHDPTDAADFRLVAHDPPPRWAADAVFYEVFPDRFSRSGATPPPGVVLSGWNDEVAEDGHDAMAQRYGGDLDGLLLRADHLVDLGITAIYTTPFFPSVSNHRYNASTFDHVDPLLGGDEALARCVEGLHARGIRVIGDLTTNHCGDDHDWFRRAQADASSPEAGFFTFRKHPNDYECWFGVRSLPKFDHRSEELARRLYDGFGSVVAKWMRPPFRLDGWRIDVANMTGRLGETDRNHEVARRLRRTMSAVDPQTFLVAEHAHDATPDLDGDGWYSTMNYAGFTNPVWSWLGAPVGAHFFGMPVPMPRHDGVAAAATIDAFAAAVSWRTRAHNFTLLDSHDSARFRSVVGGDRARQEVGIGMLLTFPGVPMLFQGDELGMEGAHAHTARTPVPWGRPDEWDRTTLAAYRSLIGLRRRLPALRSGGFRWVHVGADALAWLREDASDRILCLAVRTGGPDIVVHGLGPSALEPLYEGTGAGASSRPSADGGLVLPGDGPAFHAWRVV